MIQEHIGGRVYFLETEVTMERTLHQILARLPARRDLRRAMNKTQIAVARKCKLGQDSTSRLEHRMDLQLSTFGDSVPGDG